MYLGGDYVGQFHKGAKNGQNLGVAIDNLLHTMETTGTKSDKVKLVLRLLDPFPSTLKVLKVETGRRQPRVRPFERRKRFAA